MRYRSEIDGLRALAVVPVVLFHADLALFSGGFVGVDVFFVISGYLITSLILNDQAAGRFSVVNFYERRARRILPALFTVILFSVPFALIWLPPKDLVDFAQSMVAATTFSSNILFWRETGYFETASELKPLLHTWSLAVEEQFYIFFPLLLAALSAAKRKVTGAVILTILGVSFALAQWGSARMPTATFYLLPTRAWELMLGAIVALYLTRSDRVRGNEPLALAGIGLILAAIFLYDKSTPFPGAFALAPTVGTALVILFATEGTLAFRLLSNRAVVGFGLISYSLYLWHFPLIAFARHQALVETNLGLKLLLAALAVPIAYLSWRFVERPFRDRARLSRRQIFGYSFAVSFVIVGAGVAGHMSSGLPERMSPSQSALFATMEPSPKRDACHGKAATYTAPFKACAYPKTGGSWAVFGDSHAVELAFALAEALGERGDGLTHYSFSDCGPRLGFPTEDDPCAAWTKDSLDQIRSNPAIKNVAVTYAIVGRIEDERGDEYWRAYIETLETLVAGGKRVTLVLQAPWLESPVSRIVFGDGAGGSGAGLVGLARVRWQRRTRLISEWLDQVPDAVTIVDPANLFCDEDRCFAAKDGQALYFDDHHMSIHGARLVARAIVDAQ
ncbi:MAG: acyltransferase [Paracoccaceae bacterium]|nr:acyltransferase [Paracoccaceae bacterium]